jgi:hypothetical protein
MTANQYSHLSIGEKADLAMLAAAQEARETAIRTNTPLIIVPTMGLKPSPSGEAFRFFV